MQYKIFSIPVLGGNEETEIMNKFLRSVRVVETKKELINYDTGCYWTFCITYIFYILASSSLKYAAGRRRRLYCEVITSP